MNNDKLIEDEVRYYRKLQRRSNDLFRKADARYKIYGHDDKKAQCWELEAAGMLDEINAAIRRGVQF